MMRLEEPTQLGMTDLPRVATFGGDFPSKFGERAEGKRLLHFKMNVANVQAMWKMFT